MGLGGRGKVRTLSIIVPSTADRVVGRIWRKLSCVRRRYIPRAAHLLFLFPSPYRFRLRMRPRVRQTPTASVEGGPLGERCCSTVFNIREELLEERRPPVVVASGREKRASGPDLSSVPMRGPARYRSAKTRPIVSSGVMSRVSRL